MRQMVAAVMLGQRNINHAAEQYNVNWLTALRWIRKVEEEAEVNQLRTKLRSLEQELKSTNFKALY